MITKNRNITSLGDIKNSVGVVRGWVWMRKVGETLPHANIVEISTLETLVQVLKRTGWKPYLCQTTIAPALTLTAAILTTRSLISIGIFG